jgi:uncharacterized protein
MRIFNSALILVFISCGVSQASAQISQADAGTVTPNRAPLQANAFNPLPLGAVHPRGWLHRQLEIQATGLTGHLDEFWNDVGNNSGWLGGTGESWERGPYYLDGLLPLAYQLDDPKLKAKANRWVDWTLRHQQGDGQIGPPKNDDWWPRMVMLKVLAQYQEVSGDPRVIPLMTKYFHYELRELPKRPLKDWGKYRWQDNVYSVLWLYNRTGDKDLLKLAGLLHSQGYDWEAQFANYKYTTKQNKDKLGLKPNTHLPDAAMQTHGVNNAMAIKVAPLWSLVSHSSEDRRALYQMLAMLDKYHGLPNGMFSGDEHLAGLDPSQGIELCAVVESMFSYEEALSVLGDPRLSDRLERVTFNALPATLSNDMWSHQYDQQPNQISCTRAHRQWSTNGDDSNLFGLEPNFGCCTANLHQGWPKFVSNLWMATPDGGLFAAAYAPSQVRTSIKGTTVTVDEETNYPFEGTVRFTLHLKKSQNFPLVLRIPVWADSGTINLNNRLLKTLTSTCAAGVDHFGGKDAGCDSSKLLVPIRRDWNNGDVVTVSFPTIPRVSHWYNNSAVFERGPLVFSLPLDGQWSELKKYAQKSSDWQIQPAKKWNYAVQLGDCAATAAEHTLSETPFDVTHPPVTMTVQGKLLPQWSVHENSAGPVPSSPVKSRDPIQSLTLVPYGAAKLRITAFPFLVQKSRCQTASASASNGQ